MSSSSVNIDCDVLVIGAGVFGAWSAYRLRQSGLRVLLIDAHGPGNNRSSSGDESRIIRTGYGPDEIYTGSAVRSLRAWQEIFAASREPLFQRTGVLWLAREGDPYPSQTIATLQRLGVACEALTADELPRRYPQFAFDGIAWGFVEPQSGVLFARRAVQLVVREAVRAGVVYVPDAVPVPFDQPDGEIVTVGGRRLRATHFVFACGPWLPKLFPQLLAERIQPTRQEVFYFGAPAGDDRFKPPKMPTWIDFQDETYGLPDLDGRGIKMAIDRHGSPFDPDRDDRVASGEGLREVRERLARRLPALSHAPLVESRVCQYENTSNGDFLIDRHPDFENVWLVGGGSGHGFKHGPVVGEYLAERITNPHAEVEARFSLRTKASEHRRKVY